MKEITVTQGSPEWLALRKNYIGSSDASSIMGKSKWDTAFSTWARKMGLLPEKERSPAMWRGVELEPIAREAFIKTTGILMVPKVFTANEFQIASFDGVDFDNKIAVEIKCPMGVADHEIAMDGVVPEHYLYQLYHQMMVLGLPMMYYFSWREDSQKIIEVPFDEVEAKKLFKAEESFYLCLKNWEPPAMSEKDFTEVSDQDVIEKMRLALQYQRQEKEAKKAKEQVYQELSEYAGHTNLKTGNIKFTKCLRAGNIDYKEATKDLDIPWDNFRKPGSVYWRLS